MNVAAQRDDPKSMLALYRRLIDLRRAEPALEVGRFEALETGSDVLAYVRAAREGERSFLVALNLGGQPQRVAVPREGALALSTHLDRAQERVGATLELRPHEGVIVRLADGD